jgi:hypothetical protein
LNEQELEEPEYDVDSEEDDDSLIGGDLDSMDEFGEDEMSEEIE